MDKYHLEDGSTTELRTENTFKRYISALDLNLEELKGKKILDIGAGSGDFAAEAKKTGVDIISIDKVIGGMGAVKVANEEIPYVTGTAESLPFANDTFNLVVSVAAHNEVSLDEFEKRMTEVQRVLMPGGEYRFGPGIIELKISKNDREEFGNISSKQSAEMTLKEEERKQLLFDLLVADQLIFYRDAMSAALSCRQPLEEGQKLTSNIDEWPPRLKMPDDVNEYVNEVDNVVRNYPFNLDPYQLDDYLRALSLKILRRFDRHIDYKELPSPDNKVFKDGYYVLRKSEATAINS